MTTTNIRLLRNIGQFGSVTNHDQLNRLVLIYAENGRGKTTLAAILRSLGTGDGAHITERHRLGAADPPHVILVNAAGNWTFENGAWSQANPDIAIFDDAFVAANVCSGIEIEASHRQNLHELILGAQGVALNAELLRRVVRIEEHNRTLRLRENAIPTNIRGALSVDAFCALEQVADVDNAITEVERLVAAANAAEQIQLRGAFAPFELPGLDIAAINEVLGRTLGDIAADAGERVKQHFDKIGRNAEKWINDGMDHLSFEHDHGADGCPFCAQELTGSPVVVYFQSYFSTGYQELKTAITEAIANVERRHGFEPQNLFERAARTLADGRAFWSRFLRLEEITMDQGEIRRAWTQARDAILHHLREKQANPLQASALPADVVALVETYEQNRQLAATTFDGFVAHNGQIALVKERAGAANPAALTADLDRLKLAKVRHSADVTPLCDAYLAEKGEKVATERLRDQARADLDNYRLTIFPAYQAAINAYLGRFNAGFRLDNVGSVNNRAGSSATYTVVINNQPVTLTAGNGPSFRTTLSAGDRNTLALAFFFATLERDPRLAQKIVVIDDPMTSLDEHRSLATLQEMRRMLPRIQQMVVLSHSKPFLCEIWEGADRTTRCAMHIVRAAIGSNLEQWDVTRDLVTQHDQRHALVAGYLQAADRTIEREVAAALRPIVEVFVRAAYPITFPAGSLLGQFRDQCQRRIGSADQILNAQQTQELRELLDYANRFHHDTNAAYAMEAINDQELVSYIRRVLDFSRK